MLNQDIVFACEVTLSTRMEEDVLHYNQGARESGTHGGCRQVIPMCKRLKPTGSKNSSVGKKWTPLDERIHEVAVDICIEGPCRVRVFFDGFIVMDSVSLDNQVLNKLNSSGHNPTRGESGSNLFGKTDNVSSGYLSSLLSELQIYDGRQVVKKPRWFVFPQVHYSNHFCTYNRKHLHSRHENVNKLCVDAIWCCYPYFYNPSCKTTKCEGNASRTLSRNESNFYNMQSSWRQHKK